MASKPPNVFLDTSVLMAATISARRSARELVHHGIRGAYDLIISADVITECERHLHRKAPDAPIVAAAQAAGATYLASDDRRHLLAKRAEIEQAYGMVTATPDEILRETTR